MSMLYKSPKRRPVSDAKMECENSRYMFQCSLEGCRALLHKDGNWIELSNKTWKYQNCVILGYTLRPFELIVGAHFGDRDYKPLAKVKRGIHPEEMEAFVGVVDQIHLWKDRNGIQWIEPRLCCKIRYLDATDDDQLRIVNFEHFLIEFDPDDCQWV